MSCFSVDAPDPVSPAQVGKESLQTQIDLGPSVFNLEKLYQPKYAQLGNETLRNTLFGQQQFTVQDAARELSRMDGATVSQIEAEAKAWGLTPSEWLQGHVTEQAGLGNQQFVDAINQSGSKSPGLVDTYQQLAPFLSKLQSDANTAQRTADIADVEALGGRAQQAYRNANPDLMAAMEALKSSVGSGRSAELALPTFGGLSSAQDLSLMGGVKSDLQSELERQAMDELKSSGNLSAAGQRQAQQSARAAAADRGMVFSNQAIFQEALNSEDLRRQRLSEARAFAGQVDAAGLKSIDSARNFNLQKYGLDADLAKYSAELARVSANDQFGREATLASMLQSQAQDPFAMVLGRSVTPNQTMSAVGQANSSATGPKYFDPFNPSIMSIYAGNNANQLAANTATANNNSSIFGSVLGAGGMLGAAALICWVAREVYGPRNPKWVQFRQYILQRAPRELYEAYVDAGPRLARVVRRSSDLRGRLKTAMDRILERDSVELVTT